MSALAATPDRSRRSMIFLKPWDLWVLTLPLAAMAPMLVFQWQNLISRPERQFFPVLVVVALYFPLRALLKHGSPREQSVSVLRLGVALAALQFALLLYGLSVWAFSPWLSHLAAILIYFAWALGRCTETSWSSVLAWTGLLLITLPLPLSYDVQLIALLQTASSWACSMALDALAVPHLRLANVIEMRDQPFFIEEACSGIGSLYALLAAGGLLVLVNRRSMLVAMLTLASVPVGAMLGNFFRLLAVTLAHHYYGRDLSHGLDHELLGIVTFALAALGLWTTEWIVATVLAPVPPTEESFTFLFRAINRLLCWPNSDPFAQPNRVQPRSPGQRAPDRPRTAAPLPRRRIQPWEAKPIRLLLRSGAVAAVFLAVAPTIVLARGSAADLLALTLPEFSDAELKKLPDADAMPARLGKWQRIGFTTQQRSRASIFGAYSLIWEYARGEQRILLSLDFPFRGAHPLEYCYKGAGWTIDDVATMPADQSARWDWREVSMSNDFGAKALVYYAALTEDGQTFAVSQAANVSRRFNRRIDQVFWSHETGYEPVCYQVQVLYEGGSRLSESERSELRKSFLKARTELLARIRTLR